jgi:hypothetical protein
MPGAARALWALPGHTPVLTKGGPGVVGPLD